MLVEQVDAVGLELLERQLDLPLEGGGPRVELLEVACPLCGEEDFGATACGDEPFTDEFFTWEGIKKGKGKSKGIKCVLAP